MCRFLLNFNNLTEHHCVEAKFLQVHLSKHQNTSNLLVDFNLILQMFSSKARSGKNPSFAVLAGKLRVSGWSWNEHESFFRSTLQNKCPAAWCPPVRNSLSLNPQDQVSEIVPVRPFVFLREVTEGTNLVRRCCFGCCRRRRSSPGFGTRRAR